LLFLNRCLFQLYTLFANPFTGIVRSLHVSTSWPNILYKRIALSAMLAGNSICKVLIVGVGHTLICADKKLSVFKVTSSKTNLNRLDVMVSGSACLP